MSSTSIYSHVPYFYIIEHIPSGMRYAGCKWEEGCNPDTFMIEGGYTTSSEAVNDLIKADGLASFKTMLLITDFGFGMTSYEYETVFLQTNDIANDAKWLNGHNNDRYFSIGFHTPEYKLLMSGKYGVTHPMQNDDIKEKYRNTVFSRFGVDNPMQNKDVVIKGRNTSIEKYGVEHHNKTPAKKLAMSKRQKGSIYYNNGINNFKVYPDTIIDPNWIKGTVARDYFTAEMGVASSKLRTGTKIWNDGVRNHQVRLGQTPEPHWKLGKIKNS